MSSSLVERHERVYAPVITWDSDLEIVAAEGAWVTDVEGERYLDFACGISAAAKDQLDKVWHAGGAFRYGSLVAAAEKVLEVTPDTIEKVFFMNSGAEAVEAGTKLARKVSGRQAIVAFRGAFHGRTMGAVTFTTSKAKYREGYHPLLPSVFIAPYPHPYRWGMTEDEATDHALRELDLMLMHEITPGEIAAFLVEPVQGEGGYYPAPQRFMNRLGELCEEHGILMIHDEIHSPLGDRRQGGDLRCLGARIPRHHVRRQPGRLCCRGGQHGSPRRIPSEHVEVVGAGLRPIRRDEEEPSDDR